MRKPGQFQKFLLRIKAASFHLQQDLKPAINKIIFPIVPKNVESFVTFLFYHFLFMIASTPLARIVCGRWMGVASLQTLVNQFPFLPNTNATIFGDTEFVYKSEEESP